ncbi:prefoldin subunit 2-like protein [Perkinsela sp. CCAP 1560/4]|nr:prefoldin subunit 2-like protein [Perkinsela sp. CCAP 1560/4]|eukprot:KNH07559.1 prefoldin subunit 2-like protein [Perkinsela sp. CCAP 1560/4]
MAAKFPSPMQNNLMGRIAEIDQECIEHNIVLQELLKVQAGDAPSDANENTKERVCYRLVNNVLIKKSITEIIQELKESMQNMISVSKTLEDRLKEASKEAS